MVCKKHALATWYGPFNFIGGDHPSGLLEVTGNSGFFKLGHLGTFVAFISSNTHVQWTCGKTVLSIS
jgi:hypothetical protein